MRVLFKKFRPDPNFFSEFGPQKEILGFVVSGFNYFFLNIK